MEFAMAPYRDDILRDLAQLVAIESVAEPNCTREGFPFGEKSAEALAYMIRRAGEMGLTTENCGNYACHAQLAPDGMDGSGDGDYAAVLCHVDVVPTGDGWHTDPLVLTEKDGVLYGRGVADDKGAAVVALYCLKAMKDNGVPMKRPVRCIYGGGEEIGMDDMAAYFARHPLPSAAFTPDADYPACHCEKGILHLRFTGKTAAALKEFSGGSALNCVADSCRAVIACDEAAARSIRERIRACGASCEWTPVSDGYAFTVKGISAHAMCPQDGVNAVTAWLDAAAQAGLVESGSAEAFFAGCLCGEPNGSGIGIACADEVSGELTLNVGLIASRDGRTSLSVDIRYPATQDSAPLIRAAREAAGACGITLEVLGDNKPLYVPADHPLIRALGECYTEITGQPMKPVAMGGGTYARTLGGHGVAFGPVFADAAPSNLHRPDENLSLREFMLHAEICYRAMCRLAVLDSTE